jgi:ADP-ribose pyrophosphatase
MSDREDRPVAHAAGWELQGSSIQYENKMVLVREDRIRLPAGKEMAYAYVERGDAVIIVPITPDGQMILVRQFRYPVDDRCLEVPAGAARDTHGLSLAQVAAKELEEEVSAQCDTFERVAVFYSNPSLSDEKCHVFLAHGAVIAQRPHREPSESLETILMPVAEAFARVQRGEMKTGPTALAVLLAAPRLREVGVL